MANDEPRRASRARHLRLHGHGGAPLSALVDAALLASIAVVLGGVVVRWALLARLADVEERTRLTRDVASAALYAGLAGCLLIPLATLLRIAAFAEPGESWLGAARMILLETDAGKATLVQAIWLGGTTLAIAVARAGRDRAGRAWRAATVAALVVAVTTALRGHAASADDAALARVLMTLHVLAAGAWIGGLFHLWRATRTSTDATLVRLVQCFHPVALGAVTLLALTGLQRAFVTLPRFAAIWETGWGLWLVAKLALLAAVALLGATHWRDAGRRLETGERAGLTRSFGVELLLALAVFVVTGFLAASEPPM